MQIIKNLHSMTCGHGLLRMTKIIIGILIFDFEIEQLNLSTKRTSLIVHYSVCKIATTIPSVSEKLWNKEIKKVRDNHCL
jgi:hypothetical protein